MTGHGEGKIFLANTMSDGNGNWAFNSSGYVVKGDTVTSTATDTINNTSEFSLNKVVTIPPPGPNVVINTNNSGAGSLRNVINYSNSHPGTTIEFNIPAEDSGYNSSIGVWTIRPSTPLPTIASTGTGERR